MACVGIIVAKKKDNGECEFVGVTCKSGYLGFPKGKMEREKDGIVEHSNKNYINTRNTARRELFEETGILLNNIQFVVPFTLIDEINDKTGNISVRYYVALCRNNDEIVNFTYDKNELTNVAWYKYEEMINHSLLKKERKDVLKKAYNIILNAQQFIEGEKWIVQSPTVDECVYKNKNKNKKNNKDNQHQHRNNNNNNNSNNININKINKSISHKLSQVLRHQAFERGLDVDTDGSVYIDQLLSLRCFDKVSFSQIQIVVDSNDKKRFSLFKEITTDKWKIKANQGHSGKTAECIKDDIALTLVDKPLEICVHGTYKGALESIKNQGLSRMSRKHIHFAIGLNGENGVISGMRKSCDVFIFIDMAKCMLHGMKFYKSQNNVILTEGFDGFIPKEYFSEILQLP